jgi:hypothetical protein
MLISKLLKKLQKMDAKKVIGKNVTEKCTFSIFTHVHQIGFFVFWYLIWFFSVLSKKFKITALYWASISRGTQIRKSYFNVVCLAGELLLGAEDHHPVRPAAVQGGGRQAEVHLQADGQGQKGGSSFLQCRGIRIRNRIRIRRIRMFLGLPDPDPLVRGTVPDPNPVPDPSLFS